MNSKENHQQNEKAAHWMGEDTLFFLIFYILLLLLFLLYNIVLVLPYINMHLPQVCTCSPSWTRLPCPFPYHASGSSQCTSPKLLVSCIEPGLEIHFLYDIVHVFHYMLVPNNKNNGRAHVKSELPFHLKISPSNAYSGLISFIIDWFDLLAVQRTLNSLLQHHSSVQFSSVAQSCLTLCDPMNRSTPGLPVHHQLLEFTQTHVHRVSDAIHPSHPLSSPSPPAPNPSQHQSLFQWVNSSHEVAKVLEFQL